jgi:hypothetical protein
MPRVAKNKDVTAVQNVAEPKKRASKKVAPVEAAVVETPVAAPKKGYVFYSVYSRSRGWLTESLNPDTACEALDECYFDWLRKVNYEGKRLVFDYYILKRDTAVNTAKSEPYTYFPGSYTERKREEALRAKYGDRYREDSDGGDYDYSQYAEEFEKAGARR